MATLDGELSDAGSAGPPATQQFGSRLSLFQARLAGRDSFPAPRLGEFADMAQQDVRAAAHNTRQVMQRIRTGFRYGMARGLTVKEVLAQFDAGLFSCDQLFTRSCWSINKNSTLR